MKQHGPSINFTRHGDVGVITLNRPARLNTFRRADYETLLQLIRQIPDSGVRALVITATGRAFSAGQDLTELNVEKLRDQAEQQGILTTLQDITRSLVALDVPTLVAFNGFAVGAGLEIALACDFRIGASNSYFMFSEVRRGLFPTNGVLWLLPRLVGMAHARALLLSGHKLDAVRAERIGLLHEVLPADEVLPRGLALASELAGNSLCSMAGIKTLLRETFDVSLEETLMREVEFNRDIVSSADFSEGVSSFLEKREPDFRHRHAVAKDPALR
jgi:enoyl-CoA hydratase/carnithine racemase